MSGCRPLMTSPVPREVWVASARPGGAADAVAGLARCRPGDRAVSDVSVLYQFASAVR
jgi:hypothetical protein